jgi:hypothetical protein
MQVHLSAYPFKYPSQKMSGSHPEFECSKGMFYGTFSDEHAVRLRLKLCCHHYNTIGTLLSSDFSWDGIFSARRLHGTHSTNLNATSASAEYAGIPLCLKSLLYCYLVYQISEPTGSFRHLECLQCLAH